MLIGYVRVSKDAQTTALQVDAMKKAGVEKVFTEKESGAKDDRPVFLEMLAFARPGDTIVVWRLDRLGRSLKTLMKTVLEAARARGHNGGRPSLDIPAKKLANARKFYAQKEMPVKDIMEYIGISNKRTFYKYVVHETA